MRRHRRKGIGSARNILPAAARIVAAPAYAPFTDTAADEDPRDYYECDSPDAEIYAIWENAPVITAPAFITTQVYVFGQDIDNQENAA